MRICLLSTSLPQRCGIASYSHFLAAALSQVDFESQVILLAHGPASKSESAAYSIVPAFRGKGDFASEIMRRVAESEAEVVHIQHEYGIFGVDDCFLKLLRQLRQAGIPSVVTMHTIHTKLSLNLGCAHSEITRAFRRVDVERYQVEIARLTDQVVVHHENTIRRVLLRQGCEASRVITIPHGTPEIRIPDSIRAKRKLAIPPDAPLLVAFGYLTRSKNFHVLIEAFRRVKAQLPAARLWLGGHTKSATREAVAYVARCQRLIREAQMEGDVTFSNAFTEDGNLWQLLSAADICCFAYDEDTRSASGALHLALSFDKPVVAARIPKFQEIADVADELLVNPRSPRELARLLVRLLTDKMFCTAVQQSLRSFAIETAWPRVAREHLRMYRHLLRSSHITAAERELAI
jgi:glycosyltransferase involved in cell wall biosynthesis